MYKPPTRGIHGARSELRKRLSDVDRDLIGLVAARQKIVAEIGAHKIQNAVPTRDYEREREVLKDARDGSAQTRSRAGASRRRSCALLIRSSLTHQEQTRVAAQTSGAGKRVLIIGGAGKMGAWFAQFLGLAGLRRRDRGPERRRRPFPRSRIGAGAPRSGSHHRRDADEDRGRGAERARRRDGRSGLIIDIGSLKSPLRAGLERARRRRLQGDLDSSDVRTRHAAAVGPARRLLRRRSPRGDARGARAVRARRWPSNSR